MNNRQKICIIGGSLSGLVTAASLSKLNCNIDLIVNNFKKKNKSNRTIAISEENMNFLENLDISKSFDSYLWPCSIMKIYEEISQEKHDEIYEINKEIKKNKIFYMIKNSQLTKLLKNKIDKIKSIKVKENKKISKIYSNGLLKSLSSKQDNSKYNLIIICTGNDSDLVKNLFEERTISTSYKEESLTTIINHSPCTNNIARQIFLDNGILALLPISKSQTSIVFSIKKNKENLNDSFIKKEIHLHLKKYLKKVNFSKPIERRDLNLLIRTKYFKNRLLLFGDALHLIHPFVGQGFNMTLRDLYTLQKILKEKINLGLDIGAEDSLSDFSKEVKSLNFVFAFGVDALKKSFTIKNKYFKNARNEMIKILNKDNLSKKIFYNLADRGLKF